MYSIIIIKTPSRQAQFRTNAFYSIYDFVSELGYGHEIAEDIASWAPDAYIGETYELNGAEVRIAD